MDGFKERLVKYARSRFDMGQTRFEDYCDLGHGTISSIKSQGPTALVLMKIAVKCPDLNMNWLFRGEDGGPMLNNKSDDNLSTRVSANDINNSVVFISNWEGLEPIVEKAVNKVLRFNEK